MDNDKQAECAVDQFFGHNHCCSFFTQGRVVLVISLSMNNCCPLDWFPFERLWHSCAWWCWIAALVLYWLEKQKQLLIRHLLKCVLKHRTCYIFITDTRQASFQIMCYMFIAILLFAQKSDRLSFTFEFQWLVPNRSMALLELGVRVRVNPKTGSPIPQTSVHLRLCPRKSSCVSFDLKWRVNVWKKSAPSLMVAVWTFDEQYFLVQNTKWAVSPCDQYRLCSITTLHWTLLSFSDTLVSKSHQNKREKRDCPISYISIKHTLHLFEAC